jgi:hypothetical protein
MNQPEQVRGFAHLEEMVTTFLVSACGHTHVSKKAGAPAKPKDPGPVELPPPTEEEVAQRPDEVHERGRRPRPFAPPNLFLRPPAYVGERRREQPELHRAAQRHTRLLRQGELAPAPLGQRGLLSPPARPLDSTIPSDDRPLGPGLSGTNPDTVSGLRGASERGRAGYQLVTAPRL